MRHATLLALIALLALGAFLPAGADPRWWQHDRLVSPAPTASQAAPDVDIFTSQGSASGGALFVTWEQRSVVGGGDRDVYVAASFDGGCTFCGPVLWATGPLDESRPRIAVGATPANKLSIQVVLEREGQVYVAGDASLNAFDSAANACRNFAALATPAAVLLSRSLGAIDSRPRIAAVSRSGRLHFHACWQSLRGLPPALLQYDNDLAGDGSTWAMTGYLDLTAATGESGLYPDIAADFLGTAAADTAATVFFTDLAGTVKMLRGADSGRTWTGPAVVVSGASGNVLAAADSSAGAFGGSSAWSGAAWQGVAVPSDITFDAAKWTAPLTRSPDFDASLADVLASGPPSTPGAEPALSIAPPGSLAALAPLHVFWQNGSAPSEISARAGVVDAPSPGPPRDLDRFPFTPRRVAPPDPTLSTVEVAFSNCLWDDGWPAMSSGACTGLLRSSGLGASQVASADGISFGGLPAFFAAVFSDDRTGIPQVYVKATDGNNFGQPAMASVDAACDGLRSVTATATFDPLAACPTGAERYDRYLLYAGSEATEMATPTGPFANRAVRAAAGLASPATVALPGLKGGETYDFALIAEDEARNINPASFDPRVSGNVLVTLAQGASRLLPGCRPLLDLTCTVLGAACGGVPEPAGTSRPGDVVTVRLLFRNSNPADPADLWAATELEGTVTTNADASPLTPTIAIPAVPAGGTAFTDVQILLGASCPLAPTLSVSALLSDATNPRGPIDHGTLDCAAPIVTVDCSSTCTAPVCSLVSLTSRQLLGVKAPPDAAFSWTTDPAASEHHLNSVNDKRLIPQARRPTAGVGVPACTLPPMTSCLVPLLTPPDALLFYQAFSACGAGGSQEGPL